MKQNSLLLVLTVIGLIGSASAVGICTLGTSGLCTSPTSTSSCFTDLAAVSSCVLNKCGALTDLTKVADCYGITCKSSNPEVAKFYTTYSDCIRPDTSSTTTTTTTYSSTSDSFIQVFSGVAFVIISIVFA